jgi:hypothetical protein
MNKIVSEISVLERRINYLRLQHQERYRLSGRSPSPEEIHQLKTLENKLVIKKNELKNQLKGGE